jgi:hypothetical protein
METKRRKTRGNTYDMRNKTRLAATTTQGSPKKLHGTVIVSIHMCMYTYTVCTVKSEKEQPDLAESRKKLQ